VEFHQAHIRRQRQLQASGGGKPLGEANAVLPAPPGTIDRLGTALHNLALAVANNTTVLQQLTAANLALTATNAALTAANKKISEALAKLQLVMMASVAVLAAQNFLREFTDWEGHPAINRTWRAWKVELCQAHIMCQCQLQASGGGEPLGGAHPVLPAPAGTIDRLGTALNNLALAAANDTTVLQQLTAANLALTAANALLTAANKTLRSFGKAP
jgi:hypothetical protein